MRRALAWSAIGLLLLGFAGCSGGHPYRFSESDRSEEAAPGSRRTRSGSAPLPKHQEEPLRSLGYVSGDGGVILAANLAPVSPAPPPAAKPAETPASSTGSAMGAAALRAGNVERSSRKVVRNAQLLLVAKDTGAAVKHLTAMAPSLSGYVAGVSSARDGELMSYTVTLKVPSGFFEQAVEEAKSIALRVDGETIATEDVTDQYVDLDARFRALQGTERELLALLSESRARKSKVGDIMEVFSQLTSIRTDIEQLQGQMRKMEQVSAFSTLVVVVRPDALSRPVVTAGWRPSETLHQDLTMLAGMGRGLIDLVIGLLVLGLPVTLPVLLAVWMLYRVVRRWARTAVPGT